MPDSIGFYFSNDFLGEICNLHLSLSDQFDLGPKDPRAIGLSKLISRAVDTQKHGLAVTQDQFMVQKDEKDRVPHFMEKAPEVSRKSNKILGKLYDQVSLDADFAQCINSELLFSVHLNYKVDESIIKNKDFEQHKNLFFVIYEKAVVPFEADLRRLMLKHGIVHEAELFCSDFAYKHSL